MYIECFQHSLAHRRALLNLPANLATRGQRMIPKQISIASFVPRITRVLKLQTQKCRPLSSPCLLSAKRALCHPTWRHAIHFELGKFGVSYPGYVVFITRAQYAPGLCVCVRLYVCVCRQETSLFASYSSKISTKTLSAASSLNL